jgi:hypothetical protein
MSAWSVPKSLCTAVVVVVGGALIGCSNQDNATGASADGTGGIPGPATGGSPTDPAASGGMSASGGAGSVSTGGRSSVGGSSGAGGSSGMNTGGASGAGSGGTAGTDSGAGAADGGFVRTDSGTADGGMVGGHVGKACHSSADWTPESGDIWISPSGNDSSAGTEASPKKNLSAAISAWSAGKTIWVMPGTYAYGAAIALSTKASSSGELRISGVTGGAKPRFDFSTETRSTGNGGQRGFQISGSYVHLRYLEIANAADNCVYVTGMNNTLEWLSVHECQDTGVQLSSGAASNNVLNVDSYLNADPTGENADGFAPKLSIGPGNYFCGTRSYQNADDGYDCWSSGDSSPVTFEYCWAFAQPGPTATANGDGNGFKLGSPVSLASGGNAPHNLIHCFAFDNRSSGFTANGNSSGQITCTDCGVWGNGTAWSAGTGGQVPQHTGDITNLNVSADKAMNAARDANGDLPDITTL